MKNNYIYSIIGNNIIITSTDFVTQLIKFKLSSNLIKLNNFKDLFYALKFKNKFRKWLWEKVRLPKIQAFYNPNNLLKILKDDDDLDDVLAGWVHE
jgi:hypothetical protein